MQILCNDKGQILEFMLSDCGRMGHKAAITIETPKDLDISDFVKNFQSYYLQDNQIIKDNNYKPAKQEQLTKEQKLQLLLDSFEIDEQPDPIDGFEFIPYFDRKNMKFSWKAQYKE